MKSPADLYLLEKDIIRENLNKYSQNAFELLPQIDNPLILDIGCGSGVPTILLAKISGGEITALDNNPSALYLLQKKLKSKGLDKKVHIVEDSILNLDFPEESFDIIWAEGSVFVMGFEESIKSWGIFLKRGGFLVIHDDYTNKEENLEFVKKSSYHLLGQFDLSCTVWWEEYYAPLEDLVKKFQADYPHDSEIKGELDADQKGIEWCRSGSSMASSFIIIQKK
jgi:ubiquinone/menaquinone biosynthesis C-methylase UbiE